MNRIALFAITAAMIAGGAQAQTINNGQQNNANIRAKLNATVSSVVEDVNLTSAAIGNSITVEGNTANTINNTQRFFGDVSSELNARVSDVGKKVDVTSAAIANTASIKADWGRHCEQCPVRQL